MNGTERLRFGILCAGTTLPRWQADVIRRLREVGAEPSLLVVDGRPRPSLWETIRDTEPQHLLFRAYKALLVHPGAMTPVDLGEDLAGVPRLSCVPTRKGRFSEVFDDDDVELVRAHDLDFLIRFGFGIIRGDILKTARYGVWSYHHDDETRYRGSPPGLWEIYTGDPVTGVTLQRLTNRLDGGIILKKAYFRTERPYGRNIDATFLGSTHLPAQVCEDIRNGVASYLDAPPSKSSAPIYRMPTNPQTAVHVGREVARRLDEGLTWATRQDEWGIGLIDAPIARLLDERPPIRWIDKPRPGLYADPFGIDDGDRTLVLCEHYPRGKWDGTIAYLVLDKDGAVEHFDPDVLKIEGHASYPYLFRAGTDVYCVPETWQAREVALYRAVDLRQGRWQKEAVLLRDVPAADSTLVHHDGRWWMWTYFVENGDSHANLHLYHAPELTGPWRAHPQNPVKVDVRGSRPGGTPFEHEGFLYRPAQDCARSYGSRASLQRVLRMDPRTYLEEPVALVAPDPASPYPAGLHTLSSTGTRTLVDGKTSLLAGLGVWRRRFVRGMAAVRGSAGAAGLPVAMRR